MQKFLKFPKSVLTQGATTAFTTSLASIYVNTFQLGLVRRSSGTEVQARVTNNSGSGRDNVTITISSDNVPTINSIINAFGDASIAKSGYSPSIFEYVPPLSVTISGASGAGTTITVPSISGLSAGMRVFVISGTGAFAASTTISSIASSTSIVVSATPGTALVDATIIALPPTINTVTLD